MVKSEWQKIIFIKSLCQIYRKFFWDSKKLHKKLQFQAV